jgi:tetratricopeptide (TPR) repeat protein
VQVTALSAFASLGDSAAARIHLERLDALIGSLPRLPGQMRAWADSGRARIAMLEGDLDAAERHLRTAADAALESRDHPIIGSVALSLGTLALRRGDPAEALRALNLSTAIIGVYDHTNPEVMAIAAAALDAGLGRADETPTRPGALESLKRLVESS